MRRILMLSAWLLIASSASAREWKTWDGKFSVHAALIGYSQGIASLKRMDDGRSIHVPIGKLCDDDLLVLADWIRAQRGPPPEPPKIVKPAPDEVPKKEVKASYYTVSVGDLFTVKPEGNVWGITNFLVIEDIDTMVTAKDDAGLLRHLEQGNILTLKSGVQLRVLKVTKRNSFNPQAFAECTAILDGDSKGKVYVYTYDFSSKNVTKN